MTTLHIVTNPAALAAALATLGADDALALMHRAATIPVPALPAGARAHVLADGDAGARMLLELCLRHARSVTWR